MIVTFFNPHHIGQQRAHIGVLTKGRVVQFTKFEGDRKVPDHMRFGFIAGFGVNPSGELIIRVEVNDQFSFVHPMNLILQ